MSTPSHTLLVIDDDNSLLYSIRKSLESDKLRVLTANSAAKGLLSFIDEKPTVVLLDLRLNEASGLDTLREIRSIDASVPVLMFTAFSTTEATIEATRSGAFDYLLKPVDLSKLKAAVERAVQAFVAAAREDGGPVASLASDEEGEIRIVGSSPAMQEVYKQIGRFSASSGSVLILGESGTGKELIARAVHHYSKRRAAPFLAINCAALSETLLESELFGHERGAFTGADRRRIGKFEYASRGTIFLDEVGDMSQATQAKLLRLLQEQRFERLGGNESIETDVRVVSATNKQLETLVAQGKFRDDLYYRLNVFCVQLPPLRARLDDLPELVNFFVASYCKDFGKERVQVASEVLDAFRRYRWPGNMRELQSAVKHALAHAVGNLIRLDHLPTQVLSGVEPQAADSFDAARVLTSELLARGDHNIYEKAVGLLERIVIPLVLEHSRGNLQHACDSLGISRNTLKAKMRLHGISVEATVLSKSDGSAQVLRPTEL